MTSALENLRRKRAKLFKLSRDLSTTTTTQKVADLWWNCVYVATVMTFLLNKVNGDITENARELLHWAQDSCPMLARSPHLISSEAQFLGELRDSLRQIDPDFTLTDLQTLQIERMISQKFLLTEMLYLLFELADQCLPADNHRKFLQSKLLFYVEFIAKTPPHEHQTRLSQASNITKQDPQSLSN